MTTVDILAVAAVVAGLVMAGSPILQIRRMRRTRSSMDVSLLYLSLLSLGLIVWLAYGLALGNLAMIVSNSASLSVMILTIATAFRYRREGARRDAAGQAAVAQGKAAQETEGAADVAGGAGPA